MQSVSWRDENRISILGWTEPNSEWDVHMKREWSERRESTYRQLVAFALRTKVLVEPGSAVREDRGTQKKVSGHPQLNESSWDSDFQSVSFDTYSSEV